MRNAGQPLATLLALSRRPPPADAAPSKRSSRSRANSTSAAARARLSPPSSANTGWLLGGGVATNRRVKFVDLWSNGIGPEGGTRPARALEGNKILEKLWLNE